MGGPAPAPRSQPESAWLRDLVPMRPQGPIELVDRATAVVRTRIRDLMFVSLSINLPIWLLLGLLLRQHWAQGLADNREWFWSGVLPEPFLFLTAGPGGHGSWTFLLGRALPSLGLAATGAASGLMVGSWAAGRQMSGSQALRTIARQGHKLIALWAVIHLLETVTCVGLLAGPLVFGIAMPLWAMESGTVWGTVKRSWRLSVRELGRVLVIVVVATAIADVIGALLGLIPLVLLNFGLGGSWVAAGGTALVSLTGALPHLVLDPILGVAMALLAVDLKVRVDGADLLEELDQMKAGHG